MSLKSEHEPARNANHRSERPLWTDGPEATRVPFELKGYLV